jgi:CheY-like chemotaxis protein
VRFAKQQADQAGDGSVQPLRDVRVLVVDDNATHRVILEECLTRWGMRPVLAAGGHEALGLASAGPEPFELAIVDLQMPGMDGLELARRLRRGRDTGRDLPVVLMASAGEVDPVTAGAAGVAVTVMKPVRQSDLLDAMVDVLAAAPAVPEAATPGPAVLTPPPAGDEADGDPVLVAEDNLLNQMVAAGVLRALGYRPDVVANGREALEALERRPYAVVLMDCQMPEMDGYQATAEIRRREEGRRRVPIIAMTANAMAGDREACLAAGMDDYISKPIERRALAELLARWQQAAVVAGDGAGGEPAAADPAGGANGAGPGGRAGAVVLDAAAHELMMENFGDEGPAVLEQLIGVFLQDAPQLVATLRAATDAGRVADVRRPAHSLKSNAATLGATGLAALCQRAESLSAAGSPEELPGVVADIEAEFDGVKEAVQALQRSLAHRC